MRRLTAPLLALCLTSAALAQTMTNDQIEAAFAAGDLETARAGLADRVASDPQPLVLFRYGRMLLEGMGGDPDPQQGIALMQAAAAQGQTSAITYLGRVHLTAGPPRDPERAAQLFHQAAASGGEILPWHSLLRRGGPAAGPDVGAHLAARGGQ